jgi:putative transposase
VVRMPRTRKRFISRTLEAYRRRVRTVDQLILACFVLGMSTRKVSTALFSLLGERISASTVSEVAKALDGEVRRYHERRLSDGYRFLFFDGVVLKQKGAAKVQKRIILCACGETWEGRREMIDLLLASSESQNAWGCQGYDVPAQQARRDATGRSRAAYRLTPLMLNLHSIP